jgi:hypothetical protein
MIGKDVADIPKDVAEEVLGCLSLENAARLQRLYDDLKLR